MTSSISRFTCGLRQLRSGSVNDDQYHSSLASSQCHPLLPMADFQLFGGALPCGARPLRQM